MAALGHHTLYTGFCPLLNVNFNDVQIGRWPHLSGSLWGIPFRCYFFRKILFYSNKKLNRINCSMVYKIFLCFEFPNIPEKSRKRRRRRKPANAKRFAFQANVKSLSARSHQEFANRFFISLQKLLVFSFTFFVWCITFPL